MTFTVYLSPFTVRYPLSVCREEVLIVNRKCMVKSKSLIVNGANGGSVS